MMNIPQLFFYVFAGMAVLSSIGVVSARNTVHSVLYLVLAFVSTAGVWLLLETEFLALVLVLVYVGAVMTLFLFVVMMLDLKKSERLESFVRAWPILGLMLLMIVFMMIVATRGGMAGQGLTGPEFHAYSAGYSNVADLGSVLYTTYVWPFEIAAVLLLTAIVAAIALAHRKSTGNSLRQNASDQGAVRAADRIRIVKMTSEKKS